MYSPSWANANGSVGGDNYVYLCKLLVNKSPEDIQAGIEKLENGGSEFKPSLPELKKLCTVAKSNPSHAMLGVDFLLPEHKPSRSEETTSKFNEVRNQLKNKARETA